MSDITATPFKLRSTVKARERVRGRVRERLSERQRETETQTQKHHFGETEVDVKDTSGQKR